MIFKTSGKRGGASAWEARKSGRPVAEPLLPRTKHLTQAPRIKKWRRDGRIGDAETELALMDVIYISAQYLSTSWQTPKQGQSRQFQRELFASNSPWNSDVSTWSVLIAFWGSRSCDWAVILTPRCTREVKVQIANFEVHPTTRVEVMQRSLNGAGRDNRESFQYLWTHVFVRCTALSHVCSCWVCWYHAEHCS